jgi:hypothetical protein
MTLHPVIEFLFNHPFIGLAVLIMLLGAMWRVFEKAGQPGWAALIPIVNLFFLARVAGKPLWTVALLFIPFVNVLAAVIYGVSIARHFGKGPLFGLGLTFLGPIFYPIIGYGSARYRMVA